MPIANCQQQPTTIKQSRIKEVFDKKEVTGIILAGGASSRMGKDKGLCEFKGSALVNYAIEALLPLCQTIIISSNNIESYQKFGYQVVSDRIKDIGPIGGIYSCMKESTTKHNLVISCDTPFLNTQLMEHVLLNSENYDIVVPEHGESYIEPLAAYYSSAIIDILEDSINKKDYKLMNLFKKVKFKSINVDSFEGYSKMLFKNLNTPNDLLSCL
ncbi:MAG: molybdenum cofactor guanylyltransferase [Bacteroidota bacterium]